MLDPENQTSKPILILLIFGIPPLKCLDSYLHWQFPSYKTFELQGVLSSGEKPVQPLRSSFVEPNSEIISGLAFSMWLSWQLHTPIPSSGVDLEPAAWASHIHSCDPPFLTVFTWDFWPQKVHTSLVLWKTCKYYLQELLFTRRLPTAELISFLLNLLLQLNLHDYKTISQKKENWKVGNVWRRESYMFGFIKNYLK